MKLLVIGDVVGEAGIDALSRRLRRIIKRDTGADFVIVNGENAAGNGVLPRQADDFCRRRGRDHARQPCVRQAADRAVSGQPFGCSPSGQSCAAKRPGGWGIFDGPQGSRLLVIDLIGRCDMKYGPDNPFLCVDRILKEK